MRAVAHANDTVLVFDGYGDRDSEFRGRRVPRRDHFVIGKDVIARIQRIGAGRRLTFDGALHLPPAFDRGTAELGYDCE